MTVKDERFWFLFLPTPNAGAGTGYLACEKARYPHRSGASHAQGKASDPADVILGSTALAAVDTALIMARTEHFRTIQTCQRYGQDLPECVWISMKNDVRRRLIVGFRTLIQLTFRVQHVRE
jgi:hypothetical protein